MTPADSTLAPAWQQIAVQAGWTFTDVGLSERFLPTPPNFQTVEPAIDNSGVNGWFVDPETRTDRKSVV